MNLEYVIYGFLAVELLVLLWALRSQYRMHQEQAVYTVYNKWNYALGAAFLVLGILNLFDEERLVYGIVMSVLGIVYTLRKSGITQHNLYAEGRRIPLQDGKVVTLKEQDGCLQLYYELGIQSGTMKFATDKKDRILQILKENGY